MEQRDKELGKECGATASFEIRLGDSWRWDPGCVGQLRLYKQGQEEFDLSLVQDFIDIILDGKNITSKVSEDCIFYLISDILSGLEDISSGKRQKCIVQFYEEPFELVFWRRGDMVLITLYNVGPPRDVAAKDVAIPIDQVLHAAVGAGEQILRFLLDINGNFSKSDFVGKFVSTLKALRDTAKGRRRKRPSSQALSPSQKRTFSSSWGRAKKFGFQFYLYAGDPEFHSYSGDDAFDLHCLLFRGALAVTGMGGQRIQLPENYLFLIVESLVRSAKILLHSLDSGGATVKFRVEDRSSAFSWKRSGDRLLLVFYAKADGRRIGQIHDVTPLQFGDAVVSMASEFVKVLLDINPRQRDNLRLADFCEEIDEVRRLLLDQRTLASVAGEDVGALFQSQPSRKRVKGAPPDDLGRVRKLSYRERWRVDADFIQLDSTFLQGNRVFLLTDQAFSSLDRTTGVPRWSLPVGPEGMIISRGDRHILVYRPHTDLSLHHMVSGKRIWRKDDFLPDEFFLSPRFELLRKENKEILIFAVGREVLGLDVKEGTVLWRFSTNCGSDIHLQRFGGVVLASASDPFIYALDGLTGRLLWRFKGKPRFQGAIMAPNCHLAAWSSPFPGGAFTLLYGIEAGHGVERWRLEVPFRIMWALKSGPRLGVLVGTNDNDDVVIAQTDLVDGRILWEKEVDGSYLDTPVCPTVMKDLVIIKPNPWQLHAINLADGTMRWSHLLGCEAGGEPVDNLSPLHHDGVVFAACEAVHLIHPVTGAVVHKHHCSHDALPTMIMVDGEHNLYITEEGESLVSYEVGAKLRVVRLP